METDLAAMKARRQPAPGSKGGRELLIFATLWSLRQYPSRSREWSWSKKFEAIRAARCDGVFSPPIPALEERGDLRYLAVTSLDDAAKVAPSLEAARKLGALGVDIQLGDYDSPVEDMVKLARRIDEVASELGLPYAIETHRDTFTETPEATLALARGFLAATGKVLPLCLDHSHFAVVRHLAPGVFWERLKEPAVLLEAAAQFHLRPFNGHHCQIPVLSASGRRTPEYLAWRAYAASLFGYLQQQATKQPVWVVPELGHAAPSYGLTGFGDTWSDVLTVVRDLRQLWRAPGAS